jgi:hypothetical protein
VKLSIFLARLVNFRIIKHEWVSKLLLISMEICVDGISEQNLC